MSESDINSSHGNFLFISFSPLQWLYSIKAGLVHNCQALYNNFRQSFLGHSALTILDLVVLCEGWALTGWHDCCCLFFCLFWAHLHEVELGAPALAPSAWHTLSCWSLITLPARLRGSVKAWIWQGLLRVMEEKASRELFLLFQHSWVLLCYLRAPGSSAWLQNWCISVLWSTKG